MPEDHTRGRLSRGRKEVRGRRGGAGRVRVRERERERENEPGALHLFGSKSKVFRTSLGHSLLADLKHKRRNEHTGAWRWGHSSSRLPMSPRAF